MYSTLSVLSPCISGGIQVTDHLFARRSHSIKIDIRKSFDESISIDKLILNDIDFIGQSIKFDTHTPTKC